MNENNLVSVNKCETSKIPFIYVKPEFTDNECPTIFLYHGWSSKKENYVFMAKVLALHGFSVIVPDALNHGERGALIYNNIEVMEKEFWKTVINSIEEYKILLDKGVKDLGVNPELTSVMGSSMGGITASGIFTSDSRIKTLINMNGATAWEDAEKKVKDLRCIDRSASTGIDAIKNYDPFRQKEKLYPRPILIQHGDSDASIPVDAQKYFYEEMKKVYSDKPENLRLTIIKNLNHHKTVAMLEESIEWLNLHLKPCK